MEEIQTIGEINPIEKLQQNIDLIKNVMKNVLKDKVHFGVIKGCGDKPALFKAGAEKLLILFNLTPHLQTETIDKANGHEKYVSICTLIHRQTGETWAVASGSCSTLDSKYRYLWNYTKKECSQEYWETKDIEFNPEIGHYKDKSGKWLIKIRRENPDPADNHNTCRKMSEKKALVGTIMMCTGVSEVLTQDVEDMPLTSFSNNDNGNSKVYEKEMCPFCKVKAVGKSQYSSGNEYYCYPKSGGCGKGVNGNQLNNISPKEQSTKGDKHADIISESFPGEEGLEKYVPLDENIPF